VKLGASATSPGVTARWVAVRAPNLYDLRQGDLLLGTVRRSSVGWRAWNVWNYHTPSRARTFTHRYQAKRAVEAAVSQALREAVE